MQPELDVVHTCNPNTGEAEQEDLPQVQSQTKPQSKFLCPKDCWVAEGVVQLAGCLPSVHKALGLNPQHP